jgi:hypothetical protein
MKYFFAHLPFGRKEVYAKKVMKANLERLARLIKVCSFLMQTKVYMFWNPDFSVRTEENEGIEGKQGKRGKPLRAKSHESLILASNLSNY